MHRCTLLVACVGSALSSAPAAALAGPEIRLRYASFDPAASVPAIPAALAAPGTSRVFIVQFNASPGARERSALESRGMAILRYVPDHAYVVRAPAGLNPATIPGVRWAGAFHPAYKLDGFLLGAALAPDGEGPVPVRCGIELLERGLAAQRALDGALRAIGSRLEHFSPDGLRVEALLTPAQLVAAARLDEVSFIDPAGPAGADMDIARQISGATYLEQVAGATGQGVRGEVMDTRLDENNPAFQNPPPLLHGPLIGPPNTHGSAVYAIVFANDPTDPLHRGMVPDREQGIFADYQGLATFGGGTTLTQHLGELMDPLGPYRGVFFTSSVGSAQNSQYTTISAGVDDTLLHVDVAYTQSSGIISPGTGRPQGWAKNVISIGGVTHQNTPGRLDDSGQFGGPAADGRVKPDLAHVSDNVQVLCPSGVCPPVGFGGTSASTPLVAGGVGLVCQLWHEGTWAGFGGGSSVFDDRPHASTIRALLVNSAFQYDWTAGGPNATLTRFVQGWGMPDLQALYDRRDRTFIVDESDVLTPGQSRSYTLVVAPGETALKATMVYVDPPASPAAAITRVNDLNLRITSPTGEVYRGNHGLTTGLWSQPGGAPDGKNVIENVFVQGPAPGCWTVEVLGDAIVMDARLETQGVDADFALVVSGAVPLLWACYPDCTGDCTLTVADFGCFQGRYVLGDLYADCTGDGALTVADFGCFQGKYVLGCP